MTTLIRPFAAALLLTIPVAAQVLQAPVYQLNSAGAELVAGDLNGDGHDDLVAGGTDVMVSLRNPTGGFLTPVPYAVGSWAANVTLGDLNEDGALDLLWTSLGGSASGERRLGNGLGGFGGAASFPCPGFPNGVVFQDFDGDGDADVAVKGGSSNSVVKFLSSDGSSQLVPLAHSVQLIGIPEGFGGADLDADGDLDLVSCDYESGVGRLTVMLGNGSGGFAPKPVQQTFNGPTDTLVRDIDEDGDSDVLVCGSGLLNLQRLINSGTGTLVPSPVQAPFFNAMWLSDLDGDGYEDLIGRQSASVQVLRGQAGPDFGSPGPVMLGGFVLGSISSVAALDVDGDGLRDLVAASGQSPDSTLLKNLGFGEMAAPTRSFDGDESWRFVAKDLNGDGLGDVALSFPGGSNYGGTGGVLVRMNDGNGALAPGSWASTLPCFFLISGDLDADGDTDLVGRHALYNDGAGGFGGAVDLTTGLNVSNMACGDVDGDADDDVVLLIQSGSTYPPPGSIVTRLSNGAGGFSAPISTPFTDSRGLDLADFDMDGVLDVVVGSHNSLVVKVNLGNGTGAFPQLVTSSIFESPWEVTAGDLDADGDPDVAGTASGKLLAVTNNGAGSFSPFGVPKWYALSSAQPAIADVDGNGVQDILTPSGGAPGSLMLVLANAPGSASAWQEPSFYATGHHPVNVACTPMDADGHPDVVVQCVQHTTPEGWEFVGNTEVAVLKGLGQPEPWKHLGQGKFGAAGIPMLVGHGSLEAGDPMTLTLKGAKPLSSATVVIGTSAIFAPFKGGTLVPTPNLLLGMGTNASGGLDLAATWPANVPSGVSLWFQVWSTDVVGLAASNGVTATTP